LKKEVGTQKTRFRDTYTGRGESRHFVVQRRGHGGKFLRNKKIVDCTCTWKKQKIS